MIPELGHFALVMAFALSVALFVIPLIGSFYSNTGAMQSADSLAIGVFVFIASSFGCLSYAFLTDDFSVRLVSSHSNSLLPAMYKLSAVWGNHEGSLLLWVLILSVWMLSVAISCRGLPLIFSARVLSILGGISAGFLSFSLFTSNPYERLLPSFPADGADLNPLLQDIGLIIHPPILYIGYVGFSVPFAFAISALMQGRLDAAWARWSRPWTNIAWGFLTLGIMLGSWWAYYELGWGGWWFWDPVENASFMPWLAGTALVHSLAVTEKRGLFKSWTVLLAIFTFSLSLLGTFLVRSGVLTSVHAFASDPSRGLFILIFLFLVIGGSLSLYAIRAPTVASRVGFNITSRESFLLFNNVIFLVASLTILFGTLFPLFMDVLGKGKYSVGPPYFNIVFLPLMALLVPFMGVGPIAKWKEDRIQSWREQLVGPALVITICSIVLPLIGDNPFNLWIALSILFAGWILIGILRAFADRVHGTRGMGMLVSRLTPSFIGMSLAHFGFAITLLGVVVTHQHSQEVDLKMLPGDNKILSGYNFSFVEVRSVRGPNFLAEEARFDITREGEFVASLLPQKRRYLSSDSIMTEAGIDPGFWRDIYVAMGEPIGEQGAWAIRLHYKPMIRWIWLGAILIGMGAIITAFDKRYRRRYENSVMKGSNEDRKLAATL